MWKKENMEEEEEKEKKRKRERERECEKKNCTQSVIDEC